MKKYYILIYTFLFLSSNCYAQSVEGQVIKGAAGSAVTGAATSAGLKAAGTGALDAISPGATESIGKFMASPVGIMIVSSIGGLNAGVLYNAAKQQEDESEANIKKIDRMLSSYKDSWQGYCPNGREKLEEPSCYCYLESGKQNLERTNSKICTDLWAKNKNLFDIASKGYAGRTAFNDPVGCMTVTKQFDETCKCKKMLNSQGANACMKTVSLNTTGNALGAGYVAASGFNKVMQNLASTTSGASNLGNLSDKMLTLAIAKQGDLNNGLFQKIYSDPKKKAFPELNSVSDMLKLQSAVFKKKDLEEFSKAFGGSAALMASTSMPDKQASILKDVRNKLGIEFSGDGKGLNNNNEDKKSGLDLNFGDSASAGSGGQVLDNFPEKTYKYKNSDITTNESLSIFDIISNRYVQSGLKRLFDDGSSETTTTPETK